MRRSPLTLIFGLASVAGCATPAVLRRPPASPTMATPADASPLPAYAHPPPSDHASPQEK